MTTFFDDEINGRLAYPDGFGLEVYEHTKSGYHAVVIEGPPGAGKSSMARFLSYILNINHPIYVLTTSRPFLDPSQVAISIMDFINQTDARVILDGSIFSAMLVSEPENATSKLGLYYDLIGEVKPLFIFVDASVEDLKKCGKESEEVIVLQKEKFSRYAASLKAKGHAVLIFDRSQKI
jgi:adenylate kinase family enzyme